MRVIPFVFLLFGVITLVSSIKYIIKAPALWKLSDTRLNVGRVFVGSIVGIMLGIFLLFANTTSIVASEKDRIGVGLLAVGGLCLLIYGKEIHSKAKFGEINNFLGVHYIFLAIFLLSLSICLVVF